MTVPAQVAVSTIEGDGVTTSFAWDFLIASPAQMVVTLYDTTVDPVTLETLTASLYTATGFDDAAGGTLVYPLSGDPVSAGQFISIYRAAPLTQDVTIGRMGRFFLSEIERALDDNMRVSQDIATRITELQPIIGGVPVPVVTPPDETFNTLTATTASFSDLTVSTGTVSSRVNLSGLGIVATAVETVTSGQTLTLSGTVNFTPLSLTQSAAALSVYLPTAPQHGQVAGFSINQNVTTLTVTASGGATVKNKPLTTSTNSAGWSFSWIYHQPSTTWYRHGGVPAIAPFTPLQYAVLSFAFDFPGSIPTSSFLSTTVSFTGSVVGDQILTSVSWDTLHTVLCTTVAVRTQVSASDVARLSVSAWSAFAINAPNATFCMLRLPKSQFGF